VKAEDMSPKVSTTDQFDLTVHCVLCLCLHLCLHLHMTAGVVPCVSIISVSVIGL
jgi:hypothetical protein